MKRKPIQIMAGLINALNSFPNDKEYSINKIHDETNYHWNTVNDYIKLIILIKKFAPELKIMKETNEIVIIKQSPYFKTLNEMEQLVLYLFISRAFDKQSVIDKKKIILNNGFNLQISEEFKELINCTSDDGYYLSLKGKFHAQGILASIYKNMVDFIENKIDISSEKISENWLLNFYGDDKNSYLEKIKNLKVKNIQERKSEEVEDLTEKNQLNEIMKFSKKELYPKGIESIV